MEEVLNQMNTWEHCPDCGALLVTCPGVMLCPHCGLEQDSPDESCAALPIWFLGEGVRFHLADDRQAA